MTPLEYEIKKQIESKAFERAMTKLGFKTLEEYHSKMFKKSDKFQFLTKDEEFKFFQDKYEKELYQHEKTIKEIVEKYEESQKETALLKHLENTVWDKEKHELTLQEYIFRKTGQLETDNKFILESYKALKTIVKEG